MKIPINKKSLGNIRGPSSPSGYPHNWDKISRAFREMRHHICEECGVDCSQHRSLVEAHHKNSDKSNINNENLQCLCKFCHSNQHYHIKVSDNDMELLRKLWKEQNISVDKRE